MTSDAYRRKKGVDLARRFERRFSTAGSKGYGSAYGAFNKLTFWVAGVF